MNFYFADTQFFVALINPRDQWHQRALEAEANLIEPFYLTTEGVLTEVLTFFCEYGATARIKAVEAIELILSEANMEIITISHELFLEGVELYKQRPDKGYSLTDCISMNICRTRGITEIFTHDHHFTQEGFICSDVITQRQRRNRHTWAQERVKIEELKDFLRKRLEE